MFRKVLGIFAALLVTCGAAPAVTRSDNVPLQQRIADAQSKLEEIERLASIADDSKGGEPRDEDVRVAQHWHNHHWNNWHDWNNWHNHWGNHHRH